MKRNMDPLGGVLISEGVLTEAQLADVLEQHRKGFPLASVCFLLGYADEESLVRALSRQMGTPGVLLERCIISLHHLREIPREIALRYTLLPLYQDRHHLFVAVADQADPAVLHELAIIKGRAVIPHVALHAVLARVIRECYALLDAGDAYWFGSRTGIEDLNDPDGVLTPVLDVDDLSEAEVTAAPLDVTDPNLAVPVDPEDILSLRDRLKAGAARSEEEEVEELELGGRAPLPEPRRILLVDPDLRSREHLAGILGQEGHTIIEAADGVEAVQILRREVVELAIIEVMLPRIQGYQLCRSIKSSKRYGHIPVILTTSSSNTEHRSRDLVEQYAADDVLTRPVGQSELLGSVNHLLSRPQAPRAFSEAEQRHFDAAIALYREGQPEEAVRSLQEALGIDPLSARSHFVLGNILQHLGRTYEAIDAYEQTVALRPDYFPALSRLAFLYYKQGFIPRALETWQKSLEHCEEEAAAAKIRVFMEKIRADEGRVAGSDAEGREPGKD
ncbi:MAG: response regulator [Polyangia bacterium]|jgi:twitching motility two-component system response regulator PilH|nr:response regulator [Polyangia bacterium]